MLDLNNNSNNNVTYFESFGVEHIAKEIPKFIGNKKHNNKYLQNTSIRFDNKEIKQNELMSKKHKNACATPNYIEYFLILACTITECLSILIKKYKSIINKKKKKHDKIVLLTKSKLNIIEVLISKFLIDSVIGHDEFV